MRKIKDTKRVSYGGLTTRWIHRNRGSRYYSFFS